MSDPAVPRAAAFVRPATEGDLAALLALLRHLNPDDPPRSPEQARETWARILASPMLTVFVAELPGGALGASCTLVSVPNLTAGLSPYAIIENVVTHGEHRRLGLGQAVLGAAVAQARASGCYKIMLATGSTEPGTHAFYEKAGFCPGTKTHYEMRLAFHRPGPRLGKPR